MAQNSNYTSTNMIITENIKLYQENITYPYIASEKRKTEVLKNMNR